MEPTKEHLLWMYEQMLIIRDFEETMVNVYLEGKLPPDIQEGLAFDIGSGVVPGEMHLAAGQEPVAVGSCVHLKDDDTITCLLYTSPSPRDRTRSRMPSSA